MANNGAERARTTYTQLGLEDIYLSYAGNQPPRHPIHQALSDSATGSRVTLNANGKTAVVVRDTKGRELALLSKRAAHQWRQTQGETTRDETTVLAMVSRTKDEGKEEYHQLIQKDRWEVPILETRHHLPRQ